MKSLKCVSFSHIFFLICRILNIYKRSYGENDGRVGIAMCSLAHVKCAKGNSVMPFSYTNTSSPSTSIINSEVVQD